MNQNRFFYVIAILLPILFLVSLEGLLRLAGYGQSVPLFIKNPQAPEYTLPKPDVVNRYFSSPNSGPNVTIETNFFLTEKPSDGLRLFVQGGSTAAGFPYGYGASLAGLLDYRLKQSFVSREVEVVNTALSAVNSYTLLDFADEIIEQKPDAVLIYAGHNEFLGIMGVGSTYSEFSSRPANLLFLKFKGLRLFQLLQNGISEVQSWFVSTEAQALAKKGAMQSQTVMAKVAKHKNIDVEHPLFSAGLAQFEGNMTLLINKYREHGIPVFISTIASNLADQPPFESTEVKSEFLYVLNQLKQESVKPPKTFAKLVKKLKANAQLSGLEQHAHNVLSADAFYYVGKAYYVLGAYEQAKTNFELAKQHDLLRFRAPVEMNQIIRRLAKLPGVELVDGQKALEQASKHGIIDQKMMLEHLHPTKRGYFELSDAFYSVLSSSEMFADFELVVPRANAIRDIPLFSAEEYKGEATIAYLKSDYPFTESPQIASLPPAMNWQDKLGLNFYRKKVSWLDIANTYLERAIKNQDVSEMIKAAKLISDAVPYHSQFAFRAGSFLIQAKQAHQAPRYLKRALKHDPQNLNAKLALAHAYSITNQLKQAEFWLLEAKKQDPNNQVVKDNLKPLQRAIASGQS